MHHKPLMMHEISKCDGDRACPEHVEWVSRGAVVAGRPRDIEHFASEGMERLGKAT
jgi:hypothetical protein